MKSIGVLWDSEVEWKRDTPFDGKIDETYEYFSELAEEEALRLYIAKYRWYENGSLSKAWVFNGKKWEKVEDIELDGVFDKFLHNDETIELKREIKEDIGILNQPDLEVLTKDKLLTYQKFSEWVPATREASEKAITEMLDQYGKVVLKPRADYGGRGIHIVEEKDQIPELDGDYIVQRFVDSSGGIEGLVDGSHDLRGIVVNGEMVGSYVRFNEEGEISNVAQGGTKQHLDVEQFPEEAREIVEKVEKEMKQYRPAIYSVDFFFDEDGKPWIIELNSKPGLNFYGDPELKKRMGDVMKALIQGFKQI